MADFVAYFPPAATRLDATIVAIYLLGSLSLGVLTSGWVRRKQRAALEGPPTDHEEDYYLAGRKVPGWINGVSYAVTAINADVAPHYFGFAVVVGLPISFYYLPRFALAWMIAATLFAVRWRQLGVRTGPEFYALRFDPRYSRFVRVYSALFAVGVNMIPWIGAGLLGVHKLFGTIFGIGEIWQTLCLVLPALVLYVWTSGFAGVLVTDVLQSVIIVIAQLALLTCVVVDLGGPAGVADAVQSALPERSGEILATFPIADHPALSPWLVVLWLVVPTIGRGGSVDLEGQRLFSCRSDRDAAYMNVWAACALFFMLLLITLPAVGFLARHPEMYGASPAERENAYAMLMDDYLPTGLLGLTLAALLASVMSTVDSHLNYGSQTFVNDVLRQCFPRAQWLNPRDRRGVWTGRLLMLLILAAAITVTYNATSLIGIAVVLAGMYGATATIYWGQWWWWRVNIYSWIVAMAGGPLIYAALGGLSLGSWRVPGLLQQSAWWTSQRGASESAALGMDMLQAAIGAGFTAFLWIAVTLATSPEPMEVLTRFYRTARPMGAWGPVRRACLAEDPQWNPPERGLLLRGLALALLGASWISAGVIGIGGLFIGKWITSACLLAGAVAGCVLFRRAFDRRLQCMDADERTLAE